MNDEYFPHSESLRKQLKYTTQIWVKTVPMMQVGKIVKSGILIKLKKNKTQGQNFYQLSDDGRLFKSLNIGQYPKSYFPLLSRYVFISFLKNFSNQSVLQLEMFGKKKMFIDFDEQNLQTWLDYLCRYCIVKNLFSQRFNVQALIGKGNFSKLNLIERKITQGVLTAKSISKGDLRKSEKLKDSVLGEILILRKLNHQNILPLCEVHDDSDFIYFIYPVIKGGDLFTLFKRRKKSLQVFSEIEVSEILFHLISGLEHMHKLQIIHRDLKLENILLPNQGELNVVISDFALATQFNNQSHKRFYLSKNKLSRCGTPGYIAPEVLNLGVYNEKVDIFSAGAICYILLTQRPVFPGKDLQAILTANMSGQINYKKDCFLKLSEKAQDFILATLNLRESLRPTATECLKHEFLQLYQKSSKQDHNLGKNNTYIQSKQFDQMQQINTSNLAASIKPKAIDLQRAKRRSMRQYILLKQAINTQQETQKLTSSPLQHFLFGLQKQDLKEVPDQKDGQEITNTMKREQDDCIEDKQLGDDNKLFVSESIQQLNDSFYLQQCSLNKSQEDDQNEFSIYSSNSSEDEDPQEACLDIHEFEELDSLRQRIGLLQSVNFQKKLFYRVILNRIL